MDRDIIEELEKSNVYGSVMSQYWEIRFLKMV